MGQFAAPAFSVGGMIDGLDVEGAIARDVGAAMGKALSACRARYGVSQALTHGAAIGAVSAAMLAVDTTGDPAQRAAMLRIIARSLMSAADEREQAGGV